MGKIQLLENNYWKHFHHLGAKGGPAGGGVEIGTLDATTCRHVGRSAGRPAGRPGGARVVSGAENHLIEAAPFGRLDQMLRTTV